MNRTVVLNVAALTRSLLGEKTANLRSLLSESANIGGMLPAVTCPVQSTYLTGKPPSEHGIVANGWYFRDLAEIAFWKQSNRLVQSEKIWETARRRNPSFTCANLFWWYNMATSADWSVTPKPIYCADGRKLPDCYSSPIALRTEFTRDFGPFPLFHFWGPGTSIRSSEWIANAAVRIEEKYRPTLHLIYLPHLDYVLQKVGPGGDIENDLVEIDSLCGRLISFFRQRGCRIIVLSEYGIVPVNRAVHPNRVLREAGFLEVKVDLDREYLDPIRSPAFSVSDHQISHVYVNNPSSVGAVRAVLEKVRGIELVMGEEEKRSCGLAHERSGDLILVAEKDAWFSYYYWVEDGRAPDYARTVNIHAKPGYDPCELFLDPSIPFPKLQIGWTILKRRLGSRALLEVIPLDSDLVKGSHGRIPANEDGGPIFMTTEPRFLNGGSIEAVDVFGLILDHVFCE
ncbi:MAG: alkaline phosphatase family protein [Desulfobacteraceae bacterium]|nr:MAG: alkaline phosphatase family protein [Desulfobacteraceae bacterium]